jgi:immune inhibitor A
LILVSISAVLFSSCLWFLPGECEQPLLTKLVDGPLLHPPNPEVYEEPPFVQSSTRVYSLGTRAGPVERVVVILIEFSDVTHQGSNSVGHFNSIILDSGSNSMYEYYREASYGQTSVVGDVGSRWYRSSDPMSEYGADSSGGVDDANGPIYRLVTEAIQLADSDIDFSNYDNDGDGVVDHVIVVHAGNGQENTQTANSIWSHHWAVVDADTSAPGNQELITNDGVQVYGYIMLSENSPMGVFAHEFGHDLGLPDLYDTDGSSDGVGDWDIMGGGSWLGFPQGSQPSLPSAFSKAKLGWVDPVVVDSALTDQPIPSVWNNPAIYKLPIGDFDGEYFLVENRQQQGYDSNIPGSGLLIWHVDEDEPGNSNDVHRMVDLEEADESNGDHPLDATDPWFDSRDGFDPSSTPNSNAYGNIRTGWRVKNIGPSGDSMMADLSKQVLDDVVVVSVDADSFVDSNSNVNILVNVSNRGARDQIDLPVNLTVYYQAYGEENVVSWEEQYIASLLFEEYDWLSFNYRPTLNGLYILEVVAVLDDDEIPEDNDRFVHFNSNELFFWDDVEGGNLGWTANTSATKYRWDMIDEYPIGSYSPTHSWHFGLHEGTPSIVNISEFTLTSDNIVVPSGSDAYIVMRHKYIFERVFELGGLTNTTLKSDRGSLEITTDGTNWTEIDLWGAFPGDGVQFDWRTESFDITSRLNPGANNIKLRYVLRTEGRPVGEGWWLDDIAVVAEEPQYGLVFKVYDQEKTVEPGSIATFLFKVVNVGDYEDEFRISAKDIPTDWDFAISENASRIGFARLDTELGVDESALVYVKVQTLSSSERGNKYNATATARSLTDDNIEDEVNVTVVIASTLFDLTLDDLCLIGILLLILVLPIAMVVDYLRKTRKGY